MEILKSLGVDSTLWIQLVVFLFCYVVLTQLIFKPYLKAFKEREKRTVGSEELAVRIVEETTALQTQYEQKARAINSEIKGVYDQTRTEAMKEYDRLVQAARQESQEVLEKARVQIASEVQSARQNLLKEVPTVGAAIASRLAGKELTI